MAIDLLNRLTKTQTNTTVSQAAETSQNGESSEVAKILRSVYALKGGDVLRGELVSASGTDISLLLGDSVMLNAKMEKELALTPGQMMSFTVAKNQNGKLSLRPLFANVGMEQNAVKALDAAGIPVTDKTMMLAEEMMRQGMSVNKQSLSNVYRQMGMYPDVEVKDLVMLHKMNIPVSEENLSMMHLYQTNQHYLFSDLHGLSDQISGFLAEMVQTQPTDASETFVRAFLEVFQNAADRSGGQNTIEGMQPIDGGTLPASVNEVQEGISENQYRAEHSVQTTEDGKVVIKQGDLQQETPMQLLMPEGEAVVTKEADLMKLLSKDVLRTDSGKELLTQSLFSLLKEQFLMKPEEVRSADSIQSFYERLNEQVDKLQKLIKNVGKEESALGKEVNTIKSNIQFMNQINEYYHYVQLPLKMNQEEAKGDLYVYKRKQAKTGDDGKLTALLHLSMPNLGNMDVFLSLEEQKLSTRFCMEKEELIDFMEANMERLNERLIKKGYQVRTTVSASAKEEKAVIEEIMTTEPSIPILTSQSFDARC